MWSAASSIRSPSDQQAGEDPIDPSEGTPHGRDKGIIAAIEEEHNRFQALQSWDVDDRVSMTDVESQHHITEPPSRYSEAGLVKRMEQLGIGRPSTYARTIEVLVERCAHVVVSAIVVPILCLCEHGAG